MHSSSIDRSNQQLNIAQLQLAVYVEYLYTVLDSTRCFHQFSCFLQVLEPVSTLKNHQVLECHQLEEGASSRKNNGDNAVRTLKSNHTMSYVNLLTGLFADCCKIPSKLRGRGPSSNQGLAGILHAISAKLFRYLMLQLLLQIKARDSDEGWSRVKHTILVVNPKQRQPNWSVVVHISTVIIIHHTSKCMVACCSQTQQPHFNEK